LIVHQLCRRLINNIQQMADFGLHPPKRQITEFALTQGFDQDLLHQAVVHIIQNNNYQ
jgi:hypothetical protein